MVAVVKKLLDLSVTYTMSNKIATCVLFRKIEYSVARLNLRGNLEEIYALSASALAIQNLAP